MTTLAELARLFGRLGVTGFGGPAAHIAMMHDEVVRRRGWLDEQGFVDLIGATSLIPGPNSTELAMHVGHRRAGWRGLLVAGASFIVPAAAIVLGFAVAYERYGATDVGRALLSGVLPVVIAIVGTALVSLGRTALHGGLEVAIAVAALVAHLLEVSELLVLAAAAVVAVAVRLAPRDLGPALVLPLLAQPAAVAELPLWRLGTVFLKVGAVLYGSGYVLLAFLRTDLVTRLDVLTERQLLDAVAVGQFTPGPVFTTATFIGYLLGGWPGAVVATVAIFLPAFVLVGLSSRLVPRLRDRAWTAAVLDGVNAAALGLMAGVTLTLAGAAIVDPLTAGVGVAALILLLRTRVNTAWLVLGGAAIGLLAR